MNLATLQSPDGVQRKTLFTWTRAVLTCAAVEIAADRKRYIDNLGSLTDRAWLARQREDDERLGCCRRLKDQSHERCLEHTSTFSHCFSGLAAILHGKDPSADLKRAFDNYLAQRLSQDQIEALWGYLALMNADRPSPDYSYNTEAPL